MRTQAHTIEEPILTQLASRRKIDLADKNSVRAFARRAVDQWSMDNILGKAPIIGAYDGLPNRAKAEKLFGTLQSMGCMPRLIDMSGVVHYHPHDHTIIDGIQREVVNNKYNTVIASEVDDLNFSALQQRRLGQLVTALPDRTIVTIGEHVQVHRLSQQFLQTFASRRQPADS